MKILLSTIQIIRQSTDANKLFLNSLSEAEELQMDTLLNFGFTYLDGKFCLDKQSGNYKLGDLDSVYIKQKSIGQKERSDKIEK